MTLKSAARRGVALGLAGCAALALSACGAGQISQTANQVAAVDGASAHSDDNTIAVRDVTVVVNDDSTAALKFTAVNQDTSESTHTLESVTVGGEQVTLSEKPKLERECTVVADSKKYIDNLTKPETGCITHISTSLENNGLALGGTKDVVFNFDCLRHHRRQPAQVGPGRTHHWLRIRRCPLGPQPLAQDFSHLLATPGFALGVFACMTPVHNSVVWGQ